MPQTHFYLPLLHPNNSPRKPRLSTIRTHTSMHKLDVSDAHVRLPQLPNSRLSDQRLPERPRYQVQIQIALRRRQSHHFCRVKPRVARDVGAGQKPRQPMGRV
jgi:hypothetical protein